MDAERWRQVAQIYESAVERGPADRGAFLAEATDGDEALRREVEALLAQEQAAVLIDRPVLAVAGAVLESDAILEPNTQLGPYRVERLLGAGGMGQVYRATDPRLNRTVAVKVLPRGLAADPHFRARFDREAHTIAGLTHPHICTLHDVGHQDGIDYLVLEYLEGETLAARLEKGRLPFEQALACAIQIAEALDAAHRRGVVHRDLKPGNIMLTKGGAKLLDFGLAKPSAPVLATGASRLPTTPPELTAQGTILGTFQYMAPEQLEGRDADARTDIFAFGAVVYEMFTGKRAFEGKSQASLIGAIMHVDPPPVSATQSLTPHLLDHIVKTCLAKDPDDRWQSARDLVRELKWVSQPLRPLQSQGRSPIHRAYPRIAMMVGLVALVAAGAAAAWWLKVPAATVPHITRFTITLPSGAAFTRNGRHLLAVSPDGTRLVFVANRRLYLRALEATDPLPISGTDDLDPVEPFFSPDGEWVAFWARNQIRKVRVSGGAPVTICESLIPYGAAWAGDSIFIGAGGGGILRVPAIGGTGTKIVSADANAAEVLHGPQLLPDGESLLFTVAAAGRWDNGKIVVESLNTHVRTVVRPNGTDGRYLDSGHLTYVRDGVLYAIPFDVRRVETHGEPVALVDNIAEAGGAVGARQTGAAQAVVSTTGTLAYVPVVPVANSTLVWVDRAGREEPIPAPPRAYIHPHLSPDGRQLIALDDREDRDVWMWDFTRRTLTRMTFGNASENYPLWAADGRHIIYSSNQYTTASRIFWQAADGTGSPARLTEVSPARGQLAQFPQATVPDGSAILFREDHAGVTGQDVYLLPLAGDRTPRPLLTGPFNEANPIVSPDGRWLAYDSDESGQSEVFVRPFPAVNQGRWQVSTDGGIKPLWSPNGRELFYVSVSGRQSTRQLMAVSLDTRSTFASGSPRPLFDLSNYDRGVPGRQYDVAPDGQHFLLVKVGSAADPSRIVVVENWTDELKRRVPTQ